MLLRVSGEDAGHAGVKTAAQEADDAGFFEFFAVSPLPFVFKFGFILGLVVGGIHIVGLGRQTSVHDGQILVRQRQIEHEIGACTR